MRVTADEGDSGVRVTESEDTQRVISTEGEDTQRVTESEDTQRVISTESEDTQRVISTEGESDRVPGMSDRECQQRVGRQSCWSYRVDFGARGANSFL